MIAFYNEIVDVEIDGVTQKRAVSPFSCQGAPARARPSREPGPGVRCCCGLAADVEVEPAFGCAARGVVGGDEHTVDVDCCPHGGDEAPLRGSAGAAEADGADWYIQSGRSC